MPSELTTLLHQAADEVPGAAERFFAALLKSHVFVPLRAGVANPKPANPIGEGKDHLEESGFATVDYEGTTTLPIFTEEPFVDQWIETSTNVSEQSFEKLLWLVGDETWLYINPSQDVGKEITPWEITQLRRGEGAIPDLVAALREDIDEEIIVETGSDQFDDLKVQLLPILQIYPDLTEAFLVTIRDSENGDPKPTLGVKYEGITEAKRVYIRAEIDNASQQHLPSNQQLFLIDDLGNPDSPNWKLFADAAPFYIAQKSIDKGSTPGPVERGKKFFAKLFGRKA